jgi:hypothetical protein
MNEPKRDSALADAGRLETPVRPRAWMAQHGREPVQPTASQQQAEAWAQAGGDVVELYDGPTLWNAIATADARRRELQAQIEQLQARLAQVGLEQQRVVREERERIALKIEVLVCTCCHTETEVEFARYLADEIRGDS